MSFWLIWLLTGISAVLVMTGRYDWLPHYDLVRDTMNANALIEEGRIPEHGCLSGLFNFNPPGISWAYVPGMLVFDKCPDLAEKFAALGMSLLCLLGLYYWIRPRLGKWPAALAMLIYWAGWAGAFYQSSLWPRAHPTFYVWFMLLLTLWVERRNGIWLSAAALVYALGMYWFMEIAPAVLVIPALYFLYRPPFCWKSMAAAVAIGTLVWLPFLRFEAGRDFIDLRTQLTASYGCEPYGVESVVYDKANKLVLSWDMPSLKAEAVAQGGNLPPANEEPEGFWLETEAWGAVWAQRDVRVYMGEEGFVFYCTPLNTWAFQGFKSGRLLLQGKEEWEEGSYKVDFPNVPQPVEEPPPSPREISRRITNYAPFYNFGGTQSFGKWLWHTVLFSIALCLALWQSGLFRRLILAGMGWWDWACRRGWTAGNSDRSELRKENPAAVFWTILIVGNLVPLVFLWLIMDGNALASGHRRFMWLWITQAALIGCVLGVLRTNRLRIGLPIGILAAYTLSLNPIGRQLRNGVFKGWPGAETSREQQAVDALSAIMDAENRSEAYIGYDINLVEWLVIQRKLDPASKGGMEWDCALLLKHGIRNLDDSAEGISPKCEYVIYDPNYDVSRSDFSQNRWNMTVNGSLPEMEKVAEAGGYWILKAKP